MLCNRCDNGCTCMLLQEKWIYHIPCELYLHITSPFRVLLSNQIILDSMNVYFSYHVLINAIQNTCLFDWSPLIGNRGNRIATAEGNVLQLHTVRLIVVG